MYNTIKLKITGRKPIRLIQKLNKKNIEMWDIKQINKNEINFIIYQKDYEEVIKNKTIYSVETINYYGPKKIKDTIKKHDIFLTCLLLGLVLLIFLTHIIFKVEVIHNDKKIRNMLLNELKKYDIKPYKMVKTYDEIETIKKQILTKYQDEIEWLEIERNGTKYTVRVEERIKNKQEKETPNQDVVAKYNAVILEIDAESGDIVKKVGDYVKKGDVIISGNINLNEETKAKTSAKGTVYGETWYQVKVEVPIHYYEETKTGKKQNWYYLKIGNKKINIFHKSYKQSKNKQQVLLKNNIIPIELIKEHQQEIKINEKIYLEEEIEEVALKKAKEEIEKKLQEKEKIITIKKLNQLKKDSTIIVEFFISVKKNITSYQPIKEEEDVRNNQ